MKFTRYFLWVWMTLVLVSLTGCQADSETLPEPQPVKGVVAVRSQGAWENENSPSLFVGNTKSNDDEMLVYTLEVWTREATPRRVLRQTLNGSMTGGAQFEIALISGVYDFLFWADYGNGHYLTADLRQVTVETEAYRPGAQNDAFACAVEQVEWSGNTVLNAILKRPMARINIHNAEAFDQANPVSMVYGELYTSYDVLTGEVSAIQQDVSVSFPETTVGSTLVGEDFLFVPIEGESAMSFSVSVGDVTKDAEDVVLRSNYSTNVTVSF